MRHLSDIISSHLIYKNWMKVWTVPLLQNSVTIIEKSMTFCYSFKQPFLQHNFFIFILFLFLSPVQAYLSRAFSWIPFSIHVSIAFICPPCLLILSYSHILYLTSSSASYQLGFIFFQRWKSFAIYGWHFTTSPWRLV